MTPAEPTVSRTFSQQRRVQQTSGEKPPSVSRLWAMVGRHQGETYNFHSCAVPGTCFAHRHLLKWFARTARRKAVAVHFAIK